MTLLPKKLLPLILFGIAVTSLFSVQPAQAFTVTLDQVGSNVVANGSGAFNLTGLTFLSSPLGASKGIVPNVAIIFMGDGAFTRVDQYSGFRGPTSFGSMSTTFADTGSGDFVGFTGNFRGDFRDFVVPHGYVSGAALSDSITFDNASFASLGVRPGTYVWTWGTGLDNQNFTLVIGAGRVPDAGSTLPLLGFASLGLVALRRKLGC